MAYISLGLASSVSSQSSYGKAWTARYWVDASFATLLFSRTTEIRDGSRLSIISAYFTIYAYDALKDCLDRIDHLDFLFGEPSFVNRLDPSKTERKSFIIDADGLELANKLQQKRVAKECAAWI